MSIRKVSTWFTAVVIFLVLLIGGLTYGMKIVLDEFVLTAAAKETAGALSREMRQSSDDLTKLRGSTHRQKILSTRRYIRRL